MSPPNNFHLGTLNSYNLTVLNLRVKSNSPTSTNQENNHYPFHTYPIETKNLISHQTTHRYSKLKAKETSPLSSNTNCKHHTGFSNKSQ